MWYKLAKQKCPEIHTSAIIGLKLDYDVAEELYNCAKNLKNPETIDNYHITLIYLGKCKDLENKKDKICEVLENFAKKNTYIKGKIKNTNTFEPSESSDNKIPLYACYESDNIVEYRNKLLKELEKISVKNVSDFKDYTPHITLKYLDNEKEKNKVKNPNISCDFYKISLYFGNETHEYLLNNKKV